MEARVGTLAVGALFDTLLTGRRGVVRARTKTAMGVDTPEIVVTFLDRPGTTMLHPDVRVRVVEVTH